jgi:diguanylate cyclase (GGDEF)-like protein
MSFGKKLLIIFLIPMAIGLSVFSLLSIHYEKKDIYRWEIEKNRLLSMTISTALRKEMVHEDADKVRELVTDLKKSGLYEEMRILRISGEEAFLDLKTLKQVRKQRGRVKKTWEEDHLEVKDSPRYDNPEFRTVIQSGKEITFFERPGKTTILTTLTPIFNEPACYDCHGRKDSIRGVIQVSTNLSQAEGFIKDSLKRNILISSLILVIAAGISIFLTHQTIRPLKKLQRSICAISQGNIPTDLNINTQDEFQELGEEVQKMSLILQRQRERVQALFDASQAISSNLELEEVLQLIVERAYSLVEAKAGALTYCISREGEKPQFIFKVAGLKEHECQVKEFPSFSGLNGAVMRLGKLLKLSDYTQHPESQPLPPGHITLGPFLGAPIIIQGRSVGQVYTVREPGAPPFTTQDEEILSTFANQAAIAIQNARNYQEIQRKAERFRTLERIGDAMLSSLDLNSILKEGLDMIMKMVKVDKGMVLLKNRQDEWKVGLSQGIAEEIIPALEASVAEKGQEVALLQGKMSISEKIDLPDQGLRTCISVPLRGKGGVIGVIELFAASPTYFTGEDIESLQVAADQMAMGIENTRLYQGAKERLEQASIFRDFAEVAMIISTEEEIISAAIKALGKLFSCDYGIIFLYDPPTDSLHPTATWGIKARSPENTDSYEDAAKRCLALRRGKLFSVRESDKGLSCGYRIPFLEGKAQSYLCAPIMALGEIIGVIHLVWEQPYAFDSDHEMVLSQFTDMVALALGNMRHFQLAEKQAMTDGLTGLYNFRFFQNYLKKEMARAKRKGGKLSILMIDIDHFKEFNDTYGHDVGDEVLKSLGLTLPKLLRTADLVARYGGEEFVVLLPDTDSKGAEEVGSKVGKTLAELKIKEDSGIDLSITVSIGVATFPEHGTTPQEILKAADIALYGAKAGGRNRLVLYGSQLSP